jgi:hypothetical protein
MISSGSDPPATISMGGSGSDELSGNRSPAIRMSVPMMSEAARTP